LVAAFADLSLEDLGRGIQGRYAAQMDRLALQLLNETKVGNLDDGWNVLCEKDVL